MSERLRIELEEQRRNSTVKRPFSNRNASDPQGFITDLTHIKMVWCRNGRAARGAYREQLKWVDGPRKTAYS